jgi:hypothetical protein
MAISHRFMKTLILCFSFLACFISHADGPHPDDLLGKHYWATLDKKTKPVFLMGFRLGAGLNTFGPPQRPLTLHSGRIPRVIPLIDAFYKVHENEQVYLRSAIEICLMQLESRPKKEIEEATKKARELRVS